MSTIMQIPSTGSNYNTKQEKLEKSMLARNLSSAGDKNSTTFLRLILWALCTVGFCNIMPVCLSQFYFRVPSVSTLWFPEKLYSPGSDVPIFYQNAEYQGWSFIGWNSVKCINLPIEAHGISSVNTRGNCVVLYDKSDCEGRSLTLRPGGNSDKDLSLSGFDDLTRSIGPCV